MLIRGLRVILFLVFTIVATTLLAFTVLEWFPGLATRIHLNGIRYYAMFEEYVPDRTLVFVPRQMAHSYETDFRQDMSTPSFGANIPTVRYAASYTSEGFRTNSSARPYDAVLLGDSYLDIGENDLDTFSERLKAVSGLGTLNLGRGWYGPYQYLELFKRYGVSSGAKVAVLSFFSGNDAEDVRQYAKWLNGGDYYHFVLSRRSFFNRYLVVLEDLISPLRKEIRAQFRRSKQVQEVRESEGQLHPHDGFIRLGSEVIRMRFGYWNASGTPEQLLTSDEWTRLRSILSEFKEVARAHGIIPVVVYIPTKLQVYGRLAVDDGGTAFRSQIAQQLTFESNAEEALWWIAQDVQLEYVDLLPEFQEQARLGTILYYPFDTHWNSAGRQAAAESVARTVDRLLSNSGEGARTREAVVKTGPP